MLKEAFSSLTHLFFPHVCAGCGSDTLPADTTICMQCEHELPYTNFYKYTDNPLEKRLLGRLHLQAAASAFYFTKSSMLQQLLHELKYKGNKEVGHLLGKKMAAQVQLSERFQQVDALVPLPLFSAREKKRGYNQSTILCDAMSDVLQIPVINNAVIRSVSTESQTRKTRTERWENMEGKFVVVDEEKISNKNILLVDDVITTGATMEACGTALLAAPNVSLSILTLAYAMT